MKKELQNRRTAYLSEERIRSLALHGMLTAVIAMLTLFASVPLPVGTGGAYLNAGDAAVHLAAYVLGPVGGAVTAGVGSALADILHGAVVYAPATFVIKALMAYICGRLARRTRLVAPAVSGLVMPVGYFFFELALYGKAAALPGLWMNAIQYAFGSVAGTLLIAALPRSDRRFSYWQRLEAKQAARALEIKRSIVEAGRSMLEDGLTQGTGGNISVMDRSRGLIYITPTSMPYGEMTEEDIPVYRLNSTVVEAPHEPSMELRMHLNIYRARRDVCAIVHTHSPALIRMANRDENALHLPAAPVYPVGSRYLAEGCVKHLGKAPAVLLRGHGAVAVGKDIEEAYSRALGFETAARKAGEGDL